MVGREETNVTRVAFDNYLKGLSFMVKRHDYYLTLYSILLAWILTTLYSLFSPIYKRRIKTLVDYKVSHKVTCESPVPTLSPIVYPLHQTSPS